MSRRRIPGAKALATTWRWLRSRRGGGIILLYHRVTPETGDPCRDSWGLGVRPETFAAHLDWLAAHAEVLSLAELDRCRRHGELPPRAVAITFDDGYRDNFLRALPELLERRLPATFFLVAGHPGEPFWWDRLAGAVLAPGPLVGALRERAPDWGTGAADAPGQRQRLLTRLHGDLRDDPEGRRRLFEALSSEGALGPLDDAERCCLDGDEMAELAAAEGVEIGAHTLDHPALAELGEAEQRRQILGSRQRLEEITGTSIESFSYPYGTPLDWNPRSLRLVREAGYERAVTNVLDVATRRSPAHALPRLWIDEQSEDALARRLRRWWGN